MDQESAINVYTIQYNTIQYNTIQYNTIQYNTIQYKTESSSAWLTYPTCKPVVNSFSNRSVQIWNAIVVSDETEHGFNR